MPAQLRHIKTARDEQFINHAAKEGFRPLIIKLRPSKHVRRKFAVYQHKVTGEIEHVGDFRGQPGREWKVVIPFTNYYGYNFPAPFAAYLLPPDLAVGERVWLEDVIEDLVGTTWNQGDTYRLESCEATWTGKKFEIHCDPVKGNTMRIG